MKEIEGKAVELNLIVAPSLKLRLAADQHPTWYGAQFALLFDDFVERTDFDLLKKYIPCAFSPWGALSLWFEAGRLQIGLFFTGQTLTSLAEKRSLDLVPQLINEYPIFRVSRSFFACHMSAQILFAVRNGDYQRALEYREEIRAIMAASIVLREKLSDAVIKCNEMIGVAKQLSDISVNEAEIAESISSCLKEIIWRTVLAQKGALFVFGVDDVATAPLENEGFPIDISLSAAILKEFSVLRAEGFICFCSDDDYVHSRDLNWAPDRVSSLVSMIVNLSKTDGAIIFDKSLRVLRAGSFIKLSKIEGDSKGGARHRAARSFVDQYRGASALCISQDGTVTIF